MAPATKFYLVSADALPEIFIKVAEAKRMAASILINQVEANTTDVNENAVQFIVDWVLANRSVRTP